MISWGVVIRRILCFPLLAALAMAQSPNPAGPESGASEKALHARAAEFYQDFVDGKFRAADALVADDSKDAFFAEEKSRYKSCSVGKITMAQDRQSAVVVTSCATTFSFNGQRVPTTVPMTSHWKVQNGEWFYHVVPFDGKVKTPFGKMTVDPDGAHQAPIPANPGAMRPGMLAGVRAGKTSVTIAPDRPSQQKVEIENGLDGPVKLSMATVNIPGLTVHLDPVTLEAHSKSTLTLDYSPEKSRPSGNTTIRIRVAPLQQIIRVHLSFMEEAASKGKP
jgi:hypothetical protein